MTFNGSELKYFKNQSDKDKLSRNIVPLQEMIDIKKVQDVSWSVHRPAAGVVYQVFWLLVVLPSINFVVLLLLLLLLFIQNRKKQSNNIIYNYDKAVLTLKLFC